LLRLKLDYAPPIEKMRRLNSGFQGFDSRTSRRKKPLGLKFGVFEGLEINRGRVSLFRMGVHSVGACLHLKQWEGQLRMENAETSL
jgi:hypothetical protein